MEVTPIREADTSPITPPKPIHVFNGCIFLGIELSFVGVVDISSVSFLVYLGLDRATANLFAI